MAMNPGASKRQKELARQEKAREKEEKRVQSKKEKTEREKEKAEHTLAVTLVALDRFFFDFSDRLKDVPRAERVRLEVLMQARRTLDRSRPFANSIGNESATRCSQLVGKIAAFAALIFAPSAISFAIGPSRTGIFGGGEPPSLSGQR